MLIYFITTVSGLSSIFLLTILHFRRLPYIYCLNYAIIDFIHFILSYIISRHVSLAGVPTFFSFVRSKSSHGQLYMNALALFDIYGKYAAGNCHLSAFHAAADNGGCGFLCL